MSTNMFPPETKGHIMNYIMEKLYAIHTKRYHRSITELGERNQQLTMAQVPGFKYKGVKRSAFPLWKTAALHPELEPVADALLEKQEQLEIMEISKVKSYLRNAMNKCWSPADLFLLIPRELHTMVRKCISGYESYPETVSKDDALAFTAEYRAVSDMIKVRIMTNMILE